MRLQATMLDDETSPIDASFSDELTDLPLRPVVRTSQFSLFELFYITTLAAITIGIYIFVSPALAFAGGGALVVIAVVRWSGCRNIVFGGVVGFITSSVVAVLMISLNRMDVSTQIAIALLAPPAGYILGGALAELGNDNEL